MLRAAPISIGEPSSTIVQKDTLAVSLAALSEADIHGFYQAIVAVDEKHPSAKSAQQLKDFFLNFLKNPTQSEHKINLLNAIKIFANPNKQNNIFNKNQLDVLKKIQIDIEKYNGQQLRKISLEDLESIGQAHTQSHPSLAPVLMRSGRSIKEVIFTSIDPELTKETVENNQFIEDVWNLFYEAILAGKPETLAKLIREYPIREPFILSAEGSLAGIALLRREYVMFDMLAKADANLDKGEGIVHMLIERNDIEGISVVLSERYHFLHTKTNKKGEVFLRAVLQGKKYQILKKFLELYLINTHLLPSSLGKAIRLIRLDALFACDSKEMLDVANFVLTKTNYNINTVNNLGETALHVAIQTRSVQAARMLVEHKADTTLRTSENVSAFEMAVSLNCMEICQLLLEHKVNPNEKFSRHARTAMNFCVRDEKYHGMLTMLKHYGADARIVDSRGQAPIHVVATAKLVKELFEFKNFDPNQQDALGRTGAHMAVVHQRDDVLDFLARQKKVNLDMPDQKGMTPIKTAICSQYMTAIKILARHHAKISADLIQYAQKALTAENFAMFQRMISTKPKFSLHGFNLHHQATAPVKQPDTSHRSANGEPPLKKAKK